LDAATAGRRHALRHEHGDRFPPGRAGSDALAREPAVFPGASRSELERALKDNILAVAELVGTYER
jgi:phosphatidylethanolamine-binding protein (PEBP) family uncharacterized protein